ncbi:hypothetical protein FACS1894111_06030 [Clostridia bacterium]|nr:hypothetical protein FACS1894111_06030 [Clostridia bacterium]
MLRIKEESKKELRELGYKKCKGEYGKAGLYYKCFSVGVQVMFMGDGIYIMDWKSDDPRIHKRANCRYSEKISVYGELFELINLGYVERYF